MKQNKKIGIILYALSDFVAAAAAWLCLFLFRKVCIEQNPIEWGDKNLLFGLTLLPLAWVFFFFVLGTYTDVFRKSRLAVIGKTFLTSLIGSTIIFFILLLDDLIFDYKDYYMLFAVLLAFQFTFTLIGRGLVLTRAKSLLKRGKVGYKTLVIGGNQLAIDLYKEITQRNYNLGYQFSGFIDINGNSTNGLAEYMPKLGKVKDIEQVIDNNDIEEVILAIEPDEHHLISEVLGKLGDKKVIIKIVPGMYDILSGSVKMNHIIGAVLIEIYPDLMPKWERVFKRTFDIAASAAALWVLTPILIYVAIRVRLSSEGSIFYKQERIGINRKPFKIIKFRSMVQNAEKKGPALSSDNDTRITVWGKTMRKYRLDELPQFWNVIKGDMSLVGPRPERQFYINQIVEKAPHYLHLMKVKPGVTSLGMVKFGYAENVDQMVERLKFDLIYIENMSLSMDFKVMIYTVLILFQGKGK